MYNRITFSDRKNESLSGVIINPPYGLVSKRMSLCKYIINPYSFSRIRVLEASAQIVDRLDIAGHIIQNLSPSKVFVFINQIIDGIN